MDEEEKISYALESILILLIIIVIGIFCFAAYELNDFYNDYRCSNLPYKEFFEDKKCEKYWKYR